MSKDGSASRRNARKKGATRRRSPLEPDDITHVEVRLGPRGARIVKRRTQAEVEARREPPVLFSTRDPFNPRNRYRR